MQKRGQFRIRRELRLLGQLLTLLVVSAPTLVVAGPLLDGHEIRAFSTTASDETGGGFSYWFKSRREGVTFKVDTRLSLERDALCDHDWTGCANHAKATDTTSVYLSTVAARIGIDEKSWGLDGGIYFRGHDLKLRPSASLWFGGRAYYCFFEFGTGYPAIDLPGAGFGVGHRGDWLGLTVRADYVGSASDPNKFFVPSLLYSASADVLIADEFVVGVGGGLRKDGSSKFATLTFGVHWW